MAIEQPFLPRDLGRRTAGLRVVPNSYTDIRKRVHSETQFAVNATIQQIVPQIMPLIALETNALFAKIIRKTWEQDLTGSRPALANMHNRVADAAQIAILNAYQSSLNRNHEKNVGWRRGSRLTGRLLPALKSHGLILASANGIAFGNVDKLNKEARHWQRLNFGAGPRGAAATKGQFHLALGGGANFSVAVGEGPRPNILMPRGIWFGTRGKGRGKIVRPQQYSESRDRFQPTGPTVLYPTRGTRARHFMEAGLDVMGQQLALEYRNMFQRWNKIAVSQQRGPYYRMTARPHGTPTVPKA